MTLPIVASLLVFALAAFTVQRTAHRAEKPAKWTRNGFLGIATISMAVMVALLPRDGVLAYAILLSWLPGMILGILLERWLWQRDRPR